jgi:hypothetical protein
MGVVAGVAAATAGSLTRTSAAEPGDPLLLGQANDYTGFMTQVVNHSENVAALGVYAGGSGLGLEADSLTGIGLKGTNASSTKPALVGWSTTNTGVQGFVGQILPTTPASTGVYGYAAQDGNARGVTGETTAGRGVNGLATTGVGACGTSTDGDGVQGFSTNGAGVFAASTSGNGITAFAGASGTYGVFGGNSGGGVGTYGYSHATTGVGVFGESIAGTALKAVTVSGTAFEAQGRVKFSSSGLTGPLGVGKKSKIITPGVSIEATSAVLCTLESNQSTLSIRRVTKSITNQNFTVFLSGPVASGKTAKIAWFVIG